MSTPGTVVLRRTWPQRIVILACLGVIGAALAAAWFVNDVYVSITQVARVEISGEILLTDTAPGAPVNFLLVGEDSAAGLPPDDPAAFARVVDERGRFNADSITILRVDPTSGQAWVVSVPRDLLVDNPRNGREVNINSTLLIGGPELLIETVTDNFGITINHFITLDFLGFRELVDELDGIPVWFDHPARDRNPRGENGSGLDIGSAGCHVLDGVQALQYVRSRFYEEFIDGRWVKIGNVDFGRIERQQDFLVLALDRAIDRGARSPTTLAALIGAGAQSIVLDEELTVAELIDLGEAFRDFNPENLQRFGLTVSTEFSADGTVYLGERMVAGANDGVFDVFRGGADLPGPADVALDVYAVDAMLAEVDGGILGATVGFDVRDRWVLDDASITTMVLYPPDRLGEAETVARYLEPTPPIVETDAVTRVTVVLGSDHEQILFLFPRPVAEMRALVDAHGDVAPADLAGAEPLDTGAAPPSTTTAAPTTTTVTPTTTTPTSTTVVAADVVEEKRRIIGQAPEGETCG